MSYTYSKKIKELEVKLKELQTENNQLRDQLNLKKKPKKSVHPDII